MSAIFDTLQYVKSAVENGFTEQQAEFQAKELSKWFNKELVTKDYMQNIKNEMIIKLGGIVVTCTGILGYILKH